MKIKIRKGVFETNSSSVHSITIYDKDEELNIPKAINLKSGIFGWEVKRDYTVEERISYFLEMCIDYDKVNKYYNKSYNEDEGLVNRFIKFLQSLEIEFDAEEFYEKFNKEINEDFYYYGIDHNNDWGDLAFKFLENETDLKKFLFGTKSLLITGNDNCYLGDEWYIPYDNCSVYFKSN